MAQNIKTKKASNQIGVAIIAMAVLLLLGGIFIDDSNSNSKSNYLNSKTNINQNYPEESYIFYLNETNIGTQKKVTENFPNIELGSKEEINTIYFGNDFRLNANPLTSNLYSFQVNLEKSSEINQILIYFNSEIISGKNLLNVYANGIKVAQISPKSQNSPIKITPKFNNTQILNLQFEIEKPKWYDIFNWNKVDMKDIKVVEVRQNKNNNLKEFNFQVEKDFLERTYIDLVISCDEINNELSESIEVRVNDYILSNTNPNCISKNNKITVNIPLNILNNNKNSLELKTSGYYKVAYSINKIYFNNQESYKFTINNFNDIIDVIMYGDFDKEIIDLRLNGQTMSLKRDEIKSIVPYLRYGTNEIKFLTKPLEIKEFVIEKNEFIYG